MLNLESVPSLSLRTARIIAPISAVVVTLALLVIGGAWWAPLKVNRLALEEEQRQVANNLRHRIEGLGVDLRGASLWDEAVKNVRIAYNEEWVFNNYGSWLSQQYKHDETFVLDERDGPIFASAKGERLANAAYGRRAAAFGPLVRELRQAERAEGGAFARTRTAGVQADAYGDRPDVHLILRFALVDGRPAMLGAMPVVPDLFTVQPPPGPAAAVLSLRFMDGDVLTQVGSDLLLTGVGYAPPGRGGVAPDTPAALPLAGDPALGWVTWTPKRPGNLLRAYVLPGALAVAVAAIVSTVVAGRHARRITGDLLASEAKARHLAHHDPVTGQPNRRLFGERLDKALAAGAPLAVLYLDLDRFKEVNDTFGHAAGDELIRQVAGRLRGAVRDGDLVARLGGDEFAVLVPCLREAAEAVALGARLLAVCDHPFSIVGSDIRVSVSIGVALSPDDGDGRDELLRRADIALYRAKAQARGTCRFFSPEMDESLQLRRTVDADLRAALAAGQLELAYQPLYERDGKTVRGVEALARWTHPERGAIAPNFFVSVAEESDLIHALGEWVLRRACRDALRWPSLTVAVNLSPRQIRSVTFPRLVSGILQETGLDPGRLELEVTEGILMDESAEARNVLAELRATGVRIALDDFGTGYSSLSYLRRFEFDRVKIDRSFVRALSATPEAAAIVRAVVDLGRALGMEVTAEGVETAEQHRFLREIGCDRLQGFLFSRPLPAAEVGRLVEQARPALIEA